MSDKITEMMVDRLVEAAQAVGREYADCASWHYGHYRDDCPGLVAARRRQADAYGNLIERLRNEVYA